jgi:hypothetical protein
MSADLLPLTLCPILSFNVFVVFVGELNISLQEALKSLRLRGSLMAHLAKKANQDGTFTVYVEDRPVGLGLTSSAAGILIQRTLTR